MGQRETLPDVVQALLVKSRPSTTLVPAAWARGVRAAMVVALRKPLSPQSQQTVLFGLKPQPFAVTCESTE